MKKYLIPLIILTIVAVFFIFKISQRATLSKLRNPFISNSLPSETESPTPTTPPAGGSTPTPTPRPLTFEEMQALYGPCVTLPTLYYHHIQDGTTAKEKKQTNLTVETEYFKDQMKYLKDMSYNPITMQDLVNFFDNGVKLPTKPILITFDDGYDDFYLQAFPILQEHKFKVTLFISTGLMDNSGYLTWEQIGKMAKSGLISFGNHTWSHHSVSVSKEVDEWEIVTGDTQLTEKGHNSPRVFAYPYGDENKYAQTILTKLNYLLAFTTRPGRILCKGQRLELPRLRIGNTLLTAYGL